MEAEEEEGEEGASMEDCGREVEEGVEGIDGEGEMGGRTDRERWIERVVGGREEGAGWRLRVMQSRKMQGGMKRGRSKR